MKFSDSFWSPSFFGHQYWLEYDGMFTYSYKSKKLEIAIEHRSYSCILYVFINEPGPDMITFSFMGVDIDDMFINVESNIKSKLREAQQMIAALGSSKYRHHDSRNQRRK